MNCEDYLCSSIGKRNAFRNRISQRTQGQKQSFITFPADFHKLSQKLVFMFHAVSPFQKTKTEHMKNCPGKGRVSKQRKKLAKLFRFFEASAQRTNCMEKSLEELVWSRYSEYAWKMFLSLAGVEPFYLRLWNHHSISTVQLYLHRRGQEQFSNWHLTKRHIERR